MTSLFSFAIITTCVDWIREGIMRASPKLSAAAAPAETPGESELTRRRGRTSRNAEKYRRKEENNANL